MSAAPPPGSLWLRSLAGVVAAAWLAAGVVLLVLAWRERSRWGFAALAPLLLGYGVVWILVALHGRPRRTGETIAGLKALVRLDFAHLRPPSPARTD
ncbi:MAG: hypothetical protein LW860_11925 [Xanthomonadaceae bacterium]|jgi:hypothetical protein|nr:hypothetical protein [Xanthomonadaceae bacterium]